MVQPFLFGAAAGALGTVFSAINSEGSTHKSSKGKPLKLVVTRVCPVKPVDKRSRVSESEVACEACSGSGRMTCPICLGKARTNFTDVEVLPEGEWPKWCVDCRGTGLQYCRPCLGQGKYREPIGFRLF